MARRRGKGAGTVFEDKQRGGWVGEIDLGLSPDGKRIRKRIRGKTRKEVELALADLVTQHGKGLVVKPEKVTLGDYLDRWLAHQENKVKLTTYSSYQHSAAHLRRYLGTTELGQLHPLLIQDFITRMRRDTYTVGKSVRRYSERTIHYAFAVLKMALDQAVEWRLIPSNPTQGVDPPRPRVTKKQVWTPEQTRAFFKHVEGHRYEAVLHLAALTGLRRGEINGLKWSSIDFEKGTLTVENNRTRARRETVEGTPKTELSQRRLPLGPRLLAVLGELREKQLAEAKRRGWPEPEYVLLGRGGKPAYPTSLTATFRRLVEEAGLPYITLHGLRHSYASLARLRGVPLEVVSKTLGHSTPEFTARLYRQLYSDELTQAAHAMDGLLDQEQAPA